MDHLQIAVEATDQDSWKQRCYERMEKLKQFLGQDASSQSPLMQEKNIMSFHLYEAVENGDVDMFVDVLEKVSADKGLPLSFIFDQVTQAGDSLLHLAADFGRWQIAELISHHFPGLLTRRNICGDTVLHVAARSNNSKIIKVILSQYTVEKSKHGIKDEEEITGLRNEHGDTALHLAVYNKHVGVITELLLANKPVAHYLNKLGESPLYYSVHTGDVEIFFLLLPIPFPDPLPQCRGNSPLHAAISIQNPVVLKEILARRLELIYFKDEDGGTPLHYAAYIGYVEGVCILLDTPTQIALERNKKGHLPIHLACKMGRVKVVKELLQQEWPNSRFLLNQKGQNILHVAAKAGENNVIKYLLRNNKKIDHAMINGKDVNGNTPLHLAARNVFIESLYSLSRDKRINVKLVNDEGLTSRDTILLTCNIPSTYREYLSFVILGTAGAGAGASPSSEKVLRMLRRPKQDELNRDWAKNHFNTYMVVSILMITVTFAAGFTLPGSVNSSDDPNPHKRGMAVLVHKPMFQVFTFCNTIAMYSSTAACIVLTFVRSDDYPSVKWGTLFVQRMLAVALVTMGVAFLAAVRLVVSEVSWLADVITIIASIFLLMILLCYAFFTVRVYINLPILREVCEFFLRILIWYARTSNIKVIPNKHMDKQKQA